MVAVAALTLVSMTLVPTARADDLSAAQRRAAGEYLAAVAAGDAQAVAYAIHPDELDRLRVTLQQRLRAEAASGGDALRSRLFGAAMPLADIERLTSVDLFRTLGSRLGLRGRVYEDVRGVGTLRDGERVLAVVKGRPPKDRGTVEVVEVVPLLPYGREWKAAIPSEIEARLDDLATGRVRRAGAAEAAAAGAVRALHRRSAQAPRWKVRSVVRRPRATRRASSRCWTPPSGHWWTAAATATTGNI